MTRDIYIPEPEGPTAEFYRHAQDGTVHLQRCASCGAFRHPPRLACAHCGSAESHWVPSRGRGTLFSWTVTHFPFDRGWAGETPYVTAIVELEEGVRLLGHLETDAPGDLKIGLGLVTHVQPMTDSFAFLTFRPEGGGDD